MEGVENIPAIVADPGLKAETPLYCLVASSLVSEMVLLAAC